MENASRCTLLPDTIGENVIKIQLNPNKDETARAILFVTKGGQVYNHTHSGTKNLDSEVYINLLNVGVREVAGDNSPTKRIEHSIEKSDKPQIILAIKKGQAPGEWDSFKKDFEEYFYGDLDVDVQPYGNNSIKITVKGEKESIIINLKTNSVLYSDEINQEFVTLEGLLGKGASQLTCDIGR